MPSCPRCGFWRGKLHRRKDGLYECSRCQVVYRPVMEMALEPLFELSPLPPETRTCSYCGSSITVLNSRFCFNCGANIDESSSSAAILASQREEPASPKVELDVVRGASAAKLPNTGKMCMVCRLPLRGTDTPTWCPHCGNVAHEVHLLEWLHVKNYCPICSSHLDENELKHHMPKRGKPSDLKIRAAKLIKGNPEDVKER